MTRHYKSLLIALVLLSASGGSVFAQGTFDPRRADVNGDGIVDVADIASVISVMVAGGIADSIAAPEGAEAVDLALPSGTKWANMNVGASTPEGYGLFFAWGETVGHTSDPTDGRLFSWRDYLWMQDGRDSLGYISKYQVDDRQEGACWYDAAGRFTGDGLTILEPADDAARANWGEPWAMPTDEEMEELFANTDNEWTVQNGIPGWKFTSKANGNAIFLPASGCRDGASMGRLHEGGAYWSASLCPTYTYLARVILFYPKRAVVFNNARYDGFCVRPVIRGKLEGKYYGSYSLPVLVPQ